MCTGRKREGERGRERRRERQTNKDRVRDLTCIVRLNWSDGCEAGALGGGGLA